jgi:iron(III) transport system substrate-binding protein
MRALCGIAAVALAAACDGTPEDPTQAPTTSTEPPLVVNAPAEFESFLAPLLATWENESGGTVNVVYRGASGGPQDADVLILADVEAAVRAADDGLLLPLPPALAAAPVPARLRDPGGAWLALTWRPVVIAYDVRQLASNPPSGYAELASDAFAGRTCLAPFSQPGGEAVVAELIRELGVRPAERIVRGWIANLAEPVLTSESKLLSAVGAGRCAAGFVVRPQDTATGAGTIRFLTPDGPAGVLTAAGIARHAARPESASDLLAWLVTQAPFPDAARDVAENDLPVRDAAVTGWLHEDARKLAERAGYR